MLELFHHGIKGQKWGVRRYQFKDGTRTPLGKRHRKNDDPEQFTVLDRDFVLNKGKQLQRVTYNENEPIDDRFKYMSYTDMDKEVYASRWRAAERLYGTSYIKTYEATKDIKVAGVLESLNTLAEVNGDTPLSKLEFDNEIERMYATASKNWLPSSPSSRAQDRFADNGGATRFYYDPLKIGKGIEISKEKYDRLKAKGATDKIYRTQLYSEYYDLNTMKPKIRDAYVEKLSAKGYDAFVDLYDQNMFTEMPVVMIKPTETVREIETKLNEVAVRSQGRIAEEHGYYNWDEDWDEE